MTLAQKTLALAASYEALADEYDSAFLADADLRAVQGGANCSDASELREMANELVRLANDIALFEQN